MTQSLVQVAELQGVRFQWNTHVLQITDEGVETERGFVEADRVVVTAGLGSSLLTANSEQPLELIPVLGQAVHYRLSESPDFHPVVTRDDIHVVPLGGGEYWVGATVEFPVSNEVISSAESLTELQRCSNEFFPALADAEILDTWSGLRPPSW
jgi:glycine/D-amino acid oxidase-like deaminating enzyme